MRKDAIDYCKQYDTYQHTMFSMQAPYGLTKPLAIPTRPFTHLSMDFLELPPKITEEGKIFNTVWTIVDRFSGYVKIIPINKSYGSSRSLPVPFTLNGDYPTILYLTWILDLPGNHSRRGVSTTTLTNPLALPTTQGQMDKAK